MHVTVVLLVAQGLNVHKSVALLYFFLSLNICMQFVEISLFLPCIDV